MQRRIRRTRRLPPRKMRLHRMSRILPKNRTTRTVTFRARVSIIFSEISEPHRSLLHFSRQAPVSAGTSGCFSPQQEIFPCPRFSEDMITLSWPDARGAAAYNVYADLGNGPIKANFTTVSRGNPVQLSMDRIGRKRKGSSRETGCRCMWYHCLQGKIPRTPFLSRAVQATA